MGSGEGFTMRNRTSSRRDENEHITVGNTSFEKVKTFKYSRVFIQNQNSIQEEIKCRLKARNSCYYSVQTH